MKTLEDIKAMSYQEKDELEDLVLEIIDNNDLVKLKDILKDYPVKISCYELNIKDEDGDFPLFDPFNLIIRAAQLMKIYLMEEVEDDPCIYQNALIYDYILNADNPNSQIIKYLVNRGAKFEVYDEGYSGGLLCIFGLDAIISIIRTSIKGGANVDMQTRLIQESEYNETLLFEAVERNL